MGRARGKKNGFEDYVLDSIEDFHRFQVFVPSRLIKLESEQNSEDGEEFGVSYSMSSYFLKNMTILEAINHEPITIIFNTEGGNEIQGLAIYDRIQMSPCHVTVKVFGCAMSMGSIIMQAADDRVMSANSSLMFHDGVTFSGGNHYEAKNMADFALALGRKGDSILYEKINEKRDRDNKAHMARKTFDDMCLKSKWVFAEEAVEMGLADRVESHYSKPE